MPRIPFAPLFVQTTIVSGTFLTFHFFLSGVSFRVYVYYTTKEYHSLTLSNANSHRNQVLNSAVFVERYTWLALAWLACQAAADLVICLSMVYLLHKRRTGLQRCISYNLITSVRSLGWLTHVWTFSTDTTLNLMIMWTINTGVITAVLSVILLIVVSIFYFLPILTYMTPSIPRSWYYTTIFTFDLQFARAGFHFVVLTLGIVSRAIFVDNVEQ